ncbi:ER membrane protein complex subunit 8-like [Liolophura sinensis]|uniref:ER membrane protein complex subunit 8-like n=1 Tax=Liolophura sinensis TaxID=3198878 RepID=UPI00315901CF
MAEVSVNTRAHCKLLLHAAKYPHRAVNGLLLAEDPKSKESRKVKILDCIPLFHITLGLAPILEVALTQIDTYCKSCGLVIAGYYQANSHYSDIKPDHVAAVIGKKLHEYFSDAVLFMVDNSKMSSEKDGDLCRLYYLKDTHWALADKKYMVEEGAVSIGASLMRSEASRSLVDYDNHMDNITMDWRNTEINSLIEKCT